MARRIVRSVDLDFFEQMNTDKRMNTDIGRANILQSGPAFAVSKAKG